MKIAVSIKVRNPEYYWSKEEIKESNQEGEMSYNEWKALHSENTPKHFPSITFEFAYGVVKPTYPEGVEYDIKIVTKENTEGLYVTVTDVVVVEFIGKDHRSSVVVSNDILHQFIKAKKAKGRTYWYFYIKENCEYIPLTDTIWLSRSKCDEIYDQVGEFGVLKDEHVQRIKTTGRIYYGQ